MTYFNLYEPWNYFDRLFDDTTTFGTTTPRTTTPRATTTTRAERTLRPRMDIIDEDTKNTVVVKVELPGVRKEDVNIDVNNNVLTISGELKPHDHGFRLEGGYVVQERRCGRFVRSLPVTQGVKHDDVKASMDDGVLTVNFPKRTPEQVPKRISIS